MMDSAVFIRDHETPNSTRSISKTVTIKGSHTLEIHGFSSTKGMGVEKYVSSDTFLVGGHSWKIQFYPNGIYLEKSDGDICVSFYIELVSKCEEDVDACFEYAFLDQNGNKWHKVDTKCTIRHNERTKQRGHPRFYKRTELETSQFIKDDCLTIQCTLGVVKTSMDSPNTFSLEVLSDLKQSYMQLLESREGSDVSFEVEGETFYAHKLILSTRSPVFKAQFFGPLKEENTRGIKIEEMQAPVFKALLNYIYGDVMPVRDSKCVDIVMTHHLLVVADRYGIQTLRSLCESILCENIAIDTVGSTLAFAEQHGFFQLKSRCLEFIGLPENLEAVMQTDGFKNLKESCPTFMDELLKSVARMYRERECDANGKRLKLTK
ncbi:hypothetical protein RD792_017256 [Penstemon davidsonii]|uniref:Uncharacterized protein n=1 Tax=Penstemon davidsonii TaxID=160366 RepID=A0ABR0CLI4_9LAMI|nr:hypothetical protein RD792_017256 [Penstemon davidsonii]